MALVLNERLRTFYVFANSWYRLAAAIRVEWAVFMGRKKLNLFYIVHPLFAFGAEVFFKKAALFGFIGYTIKA